MTDQDFKDIPGFEGKYAVSQNGEVLSRLSGKLLKGNYSRGYRQVYLSISGGKGKHKTAKVHQLVAQAFIPNLQQLPAVNHKDGVKSNNSMVNLEWCTNSDNCKHAFKIGLRRPGRSPQLRLRRAVVAMRPFSGVFFRSISEASSKTGVLRSGISNVLAGRSNSAGGYMWGYL